MVTLSPKIRAERSARMVKLNAQRSQQAARGEIKLGRPKSLKTLKREEDKKAREKFLMFASANVLPIGDALVQRAKEGDVAAIKEFFDRTWGKAPQSIEHKGEVQFSLVGLATQRAMIDGNKDLTLLDVPKIEE